MQSEHRPCVRRRQLDHRLVGLDLDQGLILGDGITLGDQPLDHPPLVDALTDIWKTEYERHPAPFLFVGSETMVADWPAFLTSFRREVGEVPCPVGFST